MKFIKLVAFVVCFFFIHGIHAQRNPNNPYDGIGEQHNFALDAFLTDYSKESIGGQLTIETLVNYLCKKIGSVDCNTIRQALGSQLFTDIKGKSLVESEGIFIERGYFTARHGYFIQQINDIIEEHIQEDYQVCYKAFLSLEDQLMNDPQLSQYEKSSLLYAGAIGRYSTKFWKDIESGVARYPSIGNPGGELACCGWLKGLCQSDVKGAVSGGTVAGPPGALISGAGSSMSSAATSFWHSLW